MRKSFLYLIALNILFVGCNSTEKEGITEGSIWKLIETRVSPGGQVEFTPTNEVEFIEFQKNNEVRKNSGWCGDGSSNVVSYDEDGTIFTNCNISGTLNFEITGDIMIIKNPACIEACDYKYERVKNNSKLPLG